MSQTSDENEALILQTMTCGPNRRNILTRSQNLGDRDVDDSYGVPGSSVVEYINSNVKGSKLINI